MRYQTILTTYVPRNYTLDDLRAALLYVSPTQAQVTITTHGRNLPVTVAVKYAANSDAMAREAAAAIKTEATILGSTDVQATQVRTRNGWQNLD